MSTSALATCYAYDGKICNAYCIYHKYVHLLKRCTSISSRLVASMNRSMHKKCECQPAVGIKFYIRVLLHSGNKYPARRDFNSCCIGQDEFNPNVMSTHEIDRYRHAYSTCPCENRQLIATFTYISTYMHVKFAYFS